MALRPLSGADPAQIALVSSDNFRTIDNRFTTNVVRNVDGTNRIIQGKLPYDGGYGTLYYDANGIPSIIIGILPDGDTGLVIAKPGENVLDAFS